ncbi:hypothetical protein HYU17_05785, partial [Candidatus Woesearchaeota archaeon]|nr:hypothetical protein [Candidatus Woesearchaeota archaeon]
MTPAEPANSLTTIDDLVALFKKGDAAAVSELTGIWHAQGDDALRVGIARYI